MVQDCRWWLDRLQIAKSPQVHESKNGQVRFVCASQIVMTSSKSSTLVVHLLALPETTATSLYGLLEVLAAVGVVFPELNGVSDRQRFAPTVVSSGGRTYVSDLGIPIAAQGDIHRSEPADIIIVTDLDLNIDDDPRGRWVSECEWVQKQFAGGAIVCSVCTGAVFLAEAGLLGGVEATTHWGAADLVTSYYPEVCLRTERVLVPSGPDHRIITSGGAGSWESLALYLIARFCGQAEAVRIAKVFVLGDRSEGQLPFAMVIPRRHEDALVAKCQNWIAEHYATGHPVRRMTELAGLPDRTFKRRFKAATGYTPVEYVQALRIEEAKQLLETTSESSDNIATRVGYEDPSFFRRLFKRRVGTTPARYRQRIQATFPQAN